MDKLDVLKKCIVAFEKFFFLWVPMNIWKEWKAKLESVYYIHISVELKSSSVFLFNEVFSNLYNTSRPNK